MTIALAHAPAPGELPKRCGCGATHTAKQWAALPLLTEAWELEGERLQLRGCACGSTLAIVVTKRIN